MFSHPNISFFSSTSKQLEKERHSEIVVKPKEHVNEKIGVKSNVNGQSVDKQPIKLTRNQKKKKHEEV